MYSDYNSEDLMFSKNIETFDNPSNRCAVALLLDTSKSMKGDPMDELKRGLHTFINELKRDETASYSVELAVISFGDVPKVVADFTTVSQIDSNVISQRLPKSFGGTTLGGGMSLALDQLQSRKTFYKQNGLAYYQPWMITLSDGRAGDNATKPATRAIDLAKKRQLVHLGVGIGRKFDHNAFAPYFETSRPPKCLEHVKFKEFFIWLSNSLKMVSASTPGDDIRLESTLGWEAVGL